MGKTVALMEKHGRLETVGAREVAGQVLDGYFGGDAERVRSQSPKKALSFRALQERMEDAHWNIYKLRRVLCAEIVARKLGNAIANRLNVTLLWRLYFVNDLAVQRQLAERIANGELKGNAAYAAIAKDSVKESHGGRAPQAASLRVVRRIGRILRKAMKEHEFDAAKLGTLDDKSENAMRAAIAEIRELVDGIEQRLDS